MNLAESFEDVIRKEKKVKNELRTFVSEVLTKDDEPDKSRFHKLRDVHQLQKSIVKQNMHNAMSPISAISGYLELINISLSSNPDIKQIEHYRKQIEAGINQVNVILEQLMEIYNDESESAVSGQEDLLDVDLNWVVSEVCQQMHCAGPNVTFTRSKNPLHVRTDLFMAKLIIFNLISFAIKCSGKDAVTKMNTLKAGNRAVLSLAFSVSEKKKKELIEIMADRSDVVKTSELAKNSFNEGLTQSRNLISQIDGSISLESGNENEAVLNLSIPLSYSEN